MRFTGLSRRRFLPARSVRVTFSFSTMDTDQPRGRRLLQRHSRLEGRWSVDGRDTWPSLVSDGSVKLVAREPAALSDALRHLVLDASEREKLGDLGRAFYQRHQSRAWLLPRSNGFSAIVFMRNPEPGPCCDIGSQRLVLVAARNPPSTPRGRTLIIKRAGSDLKRRLGAQLGVFRVRLNLAKGPPAMLSRTEPIALGEVVALETVTLRRRSFDQPCLIIRPQWQLCNPSTGWRPPESYNHAISWDPQSRTSDLTPTAAGDRIKSIRRLFCHAS